MYNEPNQNPFFYLNEEIKNDLLASQRIFGSRPINNDCGQATIGNGCSTPAFVLVRNKIKFNEVIVPAQQLTNDEVNRLLDRWLLTLRYHRIILLFNDTATDKRERYQFIAEVFLNMPLPTHPAEMQFCFVYDKMGDSEKIKSPESIVNAVIEPLLNKEKIQEFFCINKRVRLNEFDNLSEPELHYVVERYQHRFKKIVSRSIKLDSKKLLNNRLIFKGSHETGYCFENHCKIARGSWQLELIPSEGSWRVIDIQIEGVEF